LLRQRILSAVILAPIAIAAVWMGSWAFVALAALAGGLLSWEWTRLCSGRFGLPGVLLAAMAVLVAVLGRQAPLGALAAIVVALFAVPLAVLPKRRLAVWMIAGVFYIGLPSLALVWLREQGRETLFWLLFVVWATDIGAYAAGLTIGGPKLLPQVSPKKTWAGLLGGILSAAVVGALTGLGIDVSPWGLAGVSGGLAIVAQGGDLAESWVKRHFGVKDSSAIIPGHGGVLDRLDGLLATAPVVALICLTFGGGLPLWR
jgi:phosphatidate cytidylyltransferase